MRAKIIIGALAYSLRIDLERLARVAKEVGAYFMVLMEYASPISGIADDGRVGRRAPSRARS